jgi:FKBP-type peptidyl-prolyl cis-trans isomerase SlyD
MVVAADKVVLIHYTLKNDEGKVLDSSAGGDPLAYNHGHGNLIPGLERELDGKPPGEKLNVEYRRCRSTGRCAQSGRGSATGLPRCPTA